MAYYFSFQVVYARLNSEFPIGPIEGVTVTIKNASTGATITSGSTAANGMLLLTDTAFALRTITISKTGYITKTLQGFSSTTDIAMLVILLSDTGYKVAAKRTFKITESWPASDMEWLMGESFIDGDYTTGFTGIGHFCIDALTPKLLSQVKFYTPTAYANWSGAANRLWFWASDDPTNPMGWKSFGSNDGIVRSVSGATDCWTITKYTNRYARNYRYWKLCPPQIARVLSGNYPCPTGYQCQYCGPVTEMEVTFI